jgi:hypothetical protein
VNEWQAPGLGNPLLLVVVGGSALVIARAVRRRPVDLAGLLLAAMGVVVAAYSVRTIAFGALLVALALARSLPGRSARPLASRSEVLPGLLALAVLLAVPGVVWGAGRGGPLPSAVDAAVAGLPAGTTTAVDVRVSGWVLWAHPGVVPMRDLRAEVYSPAVAAAYEDFSEAAPGWQDYADRHGVAAVLVDSKAPLATALSQDDQWTPAAEGGSWALWTRTR